MGENNNNINNKSSILVARNTPVALVVGAAGFLGSHLSEQLLSKGIQVIGVDDFSSGKRQYLAEAIKDKNFHLLSVSASDVDFNVLRLDYIYILAGCDWKIEEVIEIAKKYKSRILFISWIQLYDRNPPASLDWYKRAEKQLAQASHEHKLNARILRLSCVYGPRMNFWGDDPIFKLVKASLLNELQKEISSMEFSTRSLYIDDAVSLIIKSMLSGSTAMKIFDGALPQPVKISEIKQILLDPIWYEKRRFEPTELPPWYTPNLLKTIKELSWKPKVNIVEALRKTVSYFRDNEIKIEESEHLKKEEPKEQKIIPWVDTSLTKSELPRDNDTRKSLGDQKKPGKKKSYVKFSLAICSLTIIFYALIWPAISLIWGIYNLNFKLWQLNDLISAGEFENANKLLNSNKQNLLKGNDFFISYKILSEIQFLEDRIKILEDLLMASLLILNASSDRISGTESLYKSLKGITGEEGEEFESDVFEANIKLSNSYERASKAEAILYDIEGKQKLALLNNYFFTLLEYSSLNQKAVNNLKALANMIPLLVDSQKDKSYLIVIQNNLELRPSGGVVVSLVQVDTTKGKIKDIRAVNVDDLDSKLTIRVEPPKEIKEDLKKDNWLLKDSSFEPDFPTSARQMIWFYNKESGVLVDGVISLDLTALSDLLQLTGPLTIGNEGKVITSDNLMDKITSQNTDTLLKNNIFDEISQELINRIFFSSPESWPKIAPSLIKSLTQKHMMVYLSDEKLFSYFATQNWVGAISRQVDIREDKNLSENKFIDFLSIVELNHGLNYANLYIERNYFLETEIEKDGGVLQNIKIHYTNRSPSEAWPAGAYRNRIKFYLPLGSTIISALWGESDITNSFTSFSDYGRVGYSTFLNLSPKESKNLIVKYKLPKPLVFNDGASFYKLDIFKQAGTGDDPLQWKLKLPINISLAKQGEELLTKQEHLVSTEFSSDKSFEVSLYK